jgi:hypothetical protein
VLHRSTDERPVTTAMFSLHLSRHDVSFACLSNVSVYFYSLGGMELFLEIVEM